MSGSNSGGDTDDVVTTVFLFYTTSNRNSNITITNFLILLDAESSLSTSVYAQPHTLSLPQDANSRSALQDSFHLAYRPTFHYPFHKSPPMYYLLYF